MLLVFSLLITGTQVGLKVISPVSPLWAAQVTPASRLLQWRLWGCHSRKRKGPFFGVSGRKERDVSKGDWLWAYALPGSYSTAHMLLAGCGRWEPSGWTVMPDLPAQPCHEFFPASVLGNSVWDWRSTWLFYSWAASGLPTSLNEELPGTA